MAEVFSPLPPKRTPRQNLLGGSFLATTLLILVLVLVAAAGLQTGYSYWVDELWSVSASSADWGVLLRDWLIPDTHPPLYQALLKLWIGWGGNGEVATRSLSLLMAALGLAATALFASGRGAGRRLVSVAFLGTSPAWMFYAQEARSYATSLALSAVLLGLALELRQRSLAGSGNPLLARWSDRWLQRLFALACLLLSLTHYFSLLFVLVVLALGGIEGHILSRRRDVLPLLLLVSAWPLFHLLMSPLSGKLERVAWIQVQPIRGTIAEFLKGTLPLLAPGRAERALILALGLVVALLFVVPAVLRRRSPVAPEARGPALGEASFLVLILVVFLALMLPLDLVKPLSQGRYYIVAVPAVAYLCGAGWERSRGSGRARRSALAVFLALWLVLQWQLGLRELSGKTMPLQNHKLMAAFVTRSGVCDRGCWTTGWLPEALSPLYFPAGQLQRLPKMIGSVAPPLERPLLGFHNAARRLPALRAANPTMACWEAPATWQNSSFLLLPTTSSAQPASHGLRPCPP